MIVKAIACTLTARRALRKLPTSTRRQIEAKLAHCAETSGGDVKALIGTPGARLRVGDWRVIFVETDTTIEVRAVGHRRDIYRRSEDPNDRTQEQAADHRQPVGR